MANSLAHGRSHGMFVDNITSHGIYVRDFAHLYLSRSAAPFWEEISQILSRLSPKRDCSPRWVEITVS